MTQNYELPREYRVNPAVTMDAGSGGLYWDAAHIRSANHYQYQVYKFAANFAADHDVASIVDVGCGPGLKLEMLHRMSPGIKVIGIDQPAAISFCREKHDFGIWLDDDIENPGIPDDIKADLIICADVIEHLEDPDRLIDYWRRLLNPGGHIVVSTPDRVALHGTKNKQPTNRYHVREWSSDEFQAYLKGRGFCVLRQFHTLPVRLVPSRLLLAEGLRQLRSGNRLKYNQVCLIQPE